MFVDMPEPELRTYRGTVATPPDFDEFWNDSIADARRHPVDIHLAEQETLLRSVRVQDMTFRGFDGNPVRAWLRTPANAAGLLPAIVEYVGYGGGRGHPEESLLWASAGYAHIHMDNRGQGSIGSPGDTPDPQGSGPSAPGFTTRGIQSPETSYYRRLVIDAVRAIDAATDLDIVDADRVTATGVSQGGYLALAAASLSGQASAAFSFVPFFCDIPRAIRITDTEPYAEITRYLAVHRDRTAAALRTLSYLDGVNLARRGSVPMRFSAALMDATCPPSTVFAARNAYAGPASISVWPYNGHEGGGIEDQRTVLRALRAG